MYFSKLAACAVIICLTWDRAIGVVLASKAINDNKKQFHELSPVVAILGCCEDLLKLGLVVRRVRFWIVWVKLGYGVESQTFVGGVDAKLRGLLSGENPNSLRGRPFAGVSVTNWAKAGAQRTSIYHAFCVIVASYSPSAGRQQCLHILLPI